MVVSDAEEFSHLLQGLKSSKICVLNNNLVVMTISALYQLADLRYLRCPNLTSVFNFVFSNDVSVKAIFYTYRLSLPADLCGWSDELAMLVR